MSQFVVVNLYGAKYSVDLAKFQQQGENIATAIDSAIDNIAEQANVSHLPATEKIQLVGDICSQVL